jgi:hypothetical protein
LSTYVCLDFVHLHYRDNHSKLHLNVLLCVKCNIMLIKLLCDIFVGCE